MARLVLIAEFEVRRDQFDEFLASARHIASAVAAHEPRCAMYEVITSIEEPGKGAFIEVYEDEAALEAHRNTPHFAAFFEAIDGLDVRWNAGRYALES